MLRKLKACLPAALFWSAVWVLAAAAVDNQLLLPSPGAVLRALGQLTASSAAWRSIGASLARVGLGFLSGSLLGVALAAATAGWSWWDRLLSPAMRAVRSVPVVSFILLLFFWLPTTAVPAAAAGLMVLPVVWRSARQGIAAAPAPLLELAENYRLSWGRKLRFIYLPAALPALSAGWETALGLAWKSGAAAEVLCQPQRAIGTGLQASKAYLDAAGLFAWTIAIIVLSLLTESLLKALLRRWRGGGAA